MFLLLQNINLSPNLWLQQDLTVRITGLKRTPRSTKSHRSLPAIAHSSVTKISDWYWKRNEDKWCPEVYLLPMVDSSNSKEVHSVRQRWMIWYAPPWRASHSCWGIVGTRQKCPNLPLIQRCVGRDRSPMLRALFLILNYIWNEDQWIISHQIPPWSWRWNPRLILIRNSKPSEMADAFHKNCSILQFRVRL